MDLREEKKLNVELSFTMCFIFKSGLGATVSYALLIPQGDRSPCCDTVYPHAALETSVIICCKLRTVPVNFILCK